MKNKDPVVEPIFTKMIPCPGVGILEMIDTLISGTFPYRKVYEYPHPPPPGESSLPVCADGLKRS